MANNSNLVPKQIVDKNGKLTTVHVAIGGRDLTGIDTSRETILAKSEPPMINQPAGVYSFVVSAEKIDRNVMLPRKRSGRNIHSSDYIFVPVPVVDPEDAPVGIRVGEGEYHQYDGNLYLKVRNADGEVAQAEDFFEGNPELGSEYSARDWQSDGVDHQSIYNQYADNYIVMDGEVLRKTNEPMYVLATDFFINHDSVEIKVSNTPSQNNEYNFSALERDAALAKAQAAADTLEPYTAAYGGKVEEVTFHIDRINEQIRDLPVIEVVDESAVGTTYDFVARVDYPEYPKWTDGDVAHIDAVAAYRNAINSIPDAVMYDINGAKKVNWDRVPDQLRKNYRDGMKWASDNGYIL